MYIVSKEVTKGSCRCYEFCSSCHVSVYLHDNAFFKFRNL